jgi:hypothetical protein
MPHQDARYEYRAFAASFGIVEQRLRAAGGAPQIRESAEVYFVGRDDDTHNVKIRNGELDIKVLVHRARVSSSGIRSTSSNFRSRSARSRSCWPPRSRLPAACRPVRVNLPGDSPPRCMRGKTSSSSTCSSAASASWSRTASRSSRT